MSLKEYNKLPLYIVEDHNDALSFILRGIGSKHLNFEKNLLVHFDSHPDLLINQDLKAEDVFEKECLLEKVSIETWILPLAFAGHVSTIVWVKPDWSNQIEEGSHDIYIGKNKEGEIKVSAPIFYFVSALNYATYEELIEPKKVVLYVLTLNSKQESISQCRSNLLKLIEDNGNYLLDIDLDFFSTLNPFVQMYPDAKMYERLKSVYNFGREEIARTSAAEAQLKRKAQVDSLEQLFKTFEELKDSEKIMNKVPEIVSNISDKYTEDTLKKLVIDLCKNYSEDVDWDMVHNAGTTIDDPETDLPHHISTENEILLYIETFEVLLKSLPEPRMITIARSSLDDYCPPNDVEFIQENVLKVLCNAYNPEVSKHYDEV